MKIINPILPMSPINPMPDAPKLNDLPVNPIEFDGIKNQTGLLRLNKIAIAQMKLLTSDSRLPRLPGGDQP